MTRPFAEGGLAAREPSAREMEQPSTPSDAARRARKTPPGFSTRHISRSLARQCASSRAKWGTALLSTASKLSPSKDRLSTGSRRKLSSGSCGASILLAAHP